MENTLNTIKQIAGVTLLVLIVILLLVALVSAIITLINSNRAEKNKDIFITYKGYEAANLSSFCVLGFAGTAFILQAINTLMFNRTDIIIWILVISGVFIAIPYRAFFMKKFTAFKEGTFNEETKQTLINDSGTMLRKNGLSFQTWKTEDNKTLTSIFAVSDPRPIYQGILSHSLFEIEKMGKNEFDNFLKSIQLDNYIIPKH